MAFGQHWYGRTWFGGDVLRGVNPPVYLPVRAIVAPNRSRILLLDWPTRTRVPPARTRVRVSE